MIKHVVIDDSKVYGKFTIGDIELSGTDISSIARAFEAHSLAQDIISNFSNCPEDIAVKIAYRILCDIDDSDITDARDEMEWSLINKYLAKSKYSNKR